MELKNGKHFASTLVALHSRSVYAVLCTLFVHDRSGVCVLMSVTIGTLAPLKGAARAKS